MNEVFNAGGFQVVHTGRSSCNDEHGASVDCLESRNGIFCIFVIAGTDHYDVGFCFHGSFYTFFYGSESQIVDYFITGTSQEVA